jgi:glycosyltransferase involved in cell wall biosynthesis
MSEPRLSVLLIVYSMSRQALNTIYSLSAAHQRNVSADDYEIIVVENESADLLEEADVLALGSNIRYYRRSEAGVSPAPALNFAAQQARGSMLCLMIDGARMVTPRIIEYALQAQRVDENALVVVPGYNLGPAEHHFHDDHDYDETLEQQLLEQSQWQRNGYALFNIGSVGGANLQGIFHPLMESNCLFLSQLTFTAIGGADERFSEVGGGSLNQYLYRAAGLHPHSRYFFLLPGEGSFHQIHGGVSTRQREDRQQLITGFKAALEARWLETYREPYCALRREPILLGAVSRSAQRYLARYVDQARPRFRRFYHSGDAIWREDETLGLPRQNDS